MADEDDKKGDDGGGSKDSKPAITFKTEADFHREIERKSKSAVKAAVEEANKSILEALGIDSLDDLPTVVEAAKQTKVVKTETDKLKNDFTKLTKELQKSQEANAGLMQWKQRAIKANALSAYSSKTVDLETLSALVESKIAIGDDDSVSGPNGKSLEEIVNEVFKAKPFLKAPDNTPGAGTKPGAKSDAKTAPAKKADEDNKANGAPKSFGSALVQAMKAQREGNP